jgi:pimeloyl-ACP methyl ester carboxylesterase
VGFHTRDDSLAGVFVRPAGPGPHPAVALVYGSDGVDRNYGGTGPQLWGHFARHGFAVLAWDKPGVGKSTGGYNAQTFRDRADEALAAVSFLRRRKEVRPDRVGLWGHSQGGAVVPLAASLSDDVAFVIAVGGAQVVAWQQDALRVEAQLRADGFPDADVEAAVAFARRRMELIRGQGPFEELERAHAAVEKLPWFEYVGSCDRGRFYGARRLVEYDPGPA